MTDPGSEIMDELESYSDEAYFDSGKKRRVFDSELLRQPTGILPARKPILFSPESSVTDAVRAMQGEHRGCVLVTRDGSLETPLAGIFTERDVLFRIVDRGRNPATLALSEVMTADPERLHVNDKVAAVLHMMSVGGFRHIPVVDDDERPCFVVSVRDVVEMLVESFPRVILNEACQNVKSSHRAREGA
jgi:CBS domain-containing protein